VGESYFLELPFLKTLELYDMEGTQIICFTPTVCKIMMRKRHFLKEIRHEDQWKMFNVQQKVRQQGTKPCEERFHYRLSTQGGGEESLPRS
jgi:hypothetical protein